MITRPLDLESRLRPPPRSFDTLFLVNGGLLVMYFLLFGSRFVLAPGLGVDFALPEMKGSAEAAAPTDLVINVPRSNMVLVNTGRLTYEQLRGWLEEHGRHEPGLMLLVRADRNVPSGDLTIIAEMARKAGLRVHLAVEEAGNGGRQSTNGRR